MLSDICVCMFLVGRIDGLKQKFAELEELAAQRRRQLAEAAEAYQVRLLITDTANCSRVD